MSKTNNKNKVRKGDYGYIAAEKKKRILITAALFAAPLLIFFSAMIYFKTRLTVWTVIAVVGCLPACKSVVSLIMIFRAKPVAPQVYQEISKHAGELVMSYEMYMTFYEKKCNIDAIAVCGNTVVGFTSDPKADTDYMAAEAQKLVRKNGYKVDVKILKELRPFLERLDSMNVHKDSLEEGLRFTPDPRYPDYSRDEMVKHVILNLCI